VDQPRSSFCLCCRCVEVSAPHSLSSNKSSFPAKVFLGINCVHFYHSFRVFSLCSSESFFLPTLTNRLMLHAPFFGFCLAAPLDGLTPAVVILASSHIWSKSIVGSLGVGWWMSRPLPRAQDRATRQDRLLWRQIASFDSWQAISWHYILVACTQIRVILFYLQGATKM
jgi:hypothetical protein